MLKPPVPTATREHALHLRQASTDAESKLWMHLRAGRLGGLKFRRQHPFPPFVVDFYCDAARLVVELDGSQHAADVDALRTEFLERMGLSVIRYWNNDVITRTDDVLEAILLAARSRTLTPTPLPAGEGLTSTSSEPDA